MRTSVDDTTKEPKVEFIKVDDGNILVKATKGGIVSEAIISTVPPEEKTSRRSALVAVKS
jgi:hypothetical protein